LNPKGEVATDTGSNTAAHPVSGELRDRDVYCPEEEDAEVRQA